MAAKSRISKFSSSYFFILILVLSAFFLTLHDVDTHLYQRDKVYIEKLLGGFHCSPHNFFEETECIQTIQQRILSGVDVAPGIPNGHPRRPEDLYRSKKGLCFDLSFTLALALRHQGFKTRHLSLFEAGGRSFFQALTARDVQSHALLEVRTSRGWLMLDPNRVWMALDSKGLPMDFKKYRHAMFRIQWLEKPPHPFYTRAVYGVYGLYSRHGQFFPPYDFFPDVNFKELLYNI